jgi:cephalosporin hydroxylase
MAKAKITIGDAEVQQTDSFAVEGYGGNDAFELAEIQSFITAAGSDDLPTFGGSFVGGIYIQQVPIEFAQCIQTLLHATGPITRYLEIGVAAGGSAFILNHYFDFSTKGIMVLVDDNQHPKSRVRPTILSGITHYEVIGDSREGSVIDRVSGYTEGSPLFDLLMVDGEHGYGGIKQDISIYSKFLRVGGYLIFHDTQIVEPKIAFNELKQDTNWTFIDEFVSPSGPSCGIGLFRKES